ncbi:MAG: hypothetical protein OEV91_05375 [Desulfobulbaceae bacterium]|nr:hypothetical protein [Desulfobulbaceae bacterium]
MQFLRLLPVLLSTILISAHFLRSRLWLLVVISVAISALLLVRKKWAARLVQAGLVLAALEWLRTLYGLVLYRQAMGMEWKRLAVILAGVALATLLSALVFRFSALRQRYGLDDGEKAGGQ